MELSIRLDLVALLITIILAVFHIDRQQKNSSRYRVFNACLALSGLTIVLDIGAMWGILHAAELNPAINNWLSMAYFLAQHASFSLMTAYGLHLLFEHVPDRRCFRRCSAIIGVLAVLMELLVLFNPWTGWFFAFEDGVYVRGPANKLGFIVVGVEVVMAYVCYLRNRQTVSRAMHRLMHALPPLVLLLLMTQAIMPEVVLVGVASALVNMIFFISFQSNRIGQDSLTELPNRRSFLRGLTNRIAKGRKTHLILIYLERFEDVNRKYGIRQGDAILYIISRYLDRFLPRYQAFRFGNTRFMLMGTFTTQQEAEESARMIQRRFSDPFVAAGIECVLPASFAHLVTRLDMRDENRIIEELEYTLGHARTAAGNGLVFFDQRLHEMYDRKLYVLEQLRRALEEESFEIHYQPVFSCAEGRFVTAESLLRLRDDSGTPISPAEFIPLAEKNGLIDEISWLVLKKVCQFLAANPELPLRSVSINMSIQQLTDRTFAQRIHSAQAQYGVAAERLRIEITERTISENPSLVRAVMAQLAAEGVLFYLDDFGMGYSNLAGMMTLPFETIKLDASLIGGAEEIDERSMSTLRLLVQMLHHAGFAVVAEGVETRAQVERMNALGVDRIQGYYYARPMPEEELLRFLRGQG